MGTPPLRRILLVDDQREIRSIAGLALGKLGRFELHVCASGQEALEVAPDFAPDLLILDMNMPDLNGVETLERLRARGVAAPAIFFTASANDEDRERYRAIGALGLIPKPFDPLKLAAQLREIWAQYHEQRSQ